MLAVRMARTVDMPRDEWLELRRQGIGGSDIPIIAGLQPWHSRMELYLRKIGELPEPETETEAQHFGKALEAVVAAEFQRRHPGWRVRRINAILQHPEHPWMLGNVDRQVLVPGERPGILEIKTTAEWHRSEWEDGQAPFWAQAQLQWYLGLTGYPRGWLAALVGGRRYVEVEIQRDDEVIARLQDLAREFWWHVENRVPPEPDASDACTDLLDRLYPQAEAGKRTLLPLEAEELIRQYEEAAAAEAEAARRKQEAANKLKALMGDAEVGLIAGEPRVFWKTYRSERVDTKRLRAEKPEIAAQYVVETVSRRFQVR